MIFNNNNFELLTYTNDKIKFDFFYLKYNFLNYNKKWEQEFQLQDSLNLQNFLILSISQNLINLEDITYQVRLLSITPKIIAGFHFLIKSLIWRYFCKKTLVIQLVIR
jgi:hypothetical protein